MIMFVGKYERNFFINPVVNSPVKSEKCNGVALGFKAIIVWLFIYHKGHTILSTAGVF